MYNNEFLKQVGLRISDRRKELHMTQEQLSEKIGLSLQSVSCIELGKKAIRPENLVKLCNILNVTTDYVLIGKRDKLQMNDFINKVSELGSEEYTIVKSLVEYLYSKK